MLELIRATIRRRDDEGASAVEYGLLVTGIAALIVAIVFIFGNVVNKSFNNTCGRFSSGSAANASSKCQ